MGSCGVSVAEHDGGRVWQRERRVTRAGEMKRAQRDVRSLAAETTLCAVPLGGWAGVARGG